MGASPGCYSAGAEAHTMRALIVSASGFEESELLVPYYRLLEEGIAVDIASLRRGAIRGKHGYPMRANLSLREVDRVGYDALVVPGGKAPHALCAQPAALSIAEHFCQSDRAVAAICHGPQLLLAAGVMRGRRATAHPALAGELARAGAVYEDSAVVVDGNLVTSRRPADLPAFMKALLELLFSGTGRGWRARAPLAEAAARSPCG